MTTKEVNKIALSSAILFLQQTYNNLDALNEKQQDELWEFMHIIDDKLLSMAQKIRFFQ